MTSNSNVSPTDLSDDAPLRTLPDEQLSLLLTEDGISRHDVFSEVADMNLYGRKHLRTLTGAAAQRMIDAGLEPTVRQSVEWWCFVFVPVIPVGTRIVASYRDALPDGDDHGRSIPTAMDWRQAFGHAILGVLGTSVVAGVIVAAIWSE